MFTKKRKMSPQNFNLMVQNGPTKNACFEKAPNVMHPTKF